MEAKTWEELAEARYTGAKDRLVKSEARFASYMDLEAISLMHEKVKEGLAVIEAHLERMKAFGGHTELFEFTKAEVQLAEAEVQLAKTEAELVVEMIQFDMSIDQENKMATRFLGEEAVRLAETEVRLLEAELRLLGVDIDLMIDTLNDPILHHSQVWLAHADMELRQHRHDGEDRPDFLDDAFWQQYNEMQRLATLSEASAKANAGVAYAEAQVQLAEAKVQLAEAELRVTKAKLRVAKTYDRDDYL